MLSGGFFGSKFSAGPFSRAENLLNFRLAASPDENFQLARFFGPGHGIALSLHVATATDSGKVADLPKMYLSYVAPAGVRTNHRTHRVRMDQGPRVRVAPTAIR